MPLWISTASNTSDIFTKNLPGPQFDKFLPTYCTDEGVPPEATTIRTIDCCDKPVSHSITPNNTDAQQVSIFEDPSNSQLRDINGDNPKKKADHDHIQQHEAPNSAMSVKPKVESETALVVGKLQHMIKEVKMTNAQNAATSV